MNKNRFTQAENLVAIGKPVPYKSPHFSLSSYQAKSATEVSY